MPMQTKNCRSAAGYFLMRTTHPKDYYMRSLFWANPETYPVTLEPGLAMSTVGGPLAPMSIGLSVGNVNQVVGFVLDRETIAVGAKAWIRYIVGGIPYGSGQAPQGIILNWNDAAEGAYPFGSDQGGAFPAMARSSPGGTVNAQYVTACTNLGFTLIQMSTLKISEQPLMAESSMSEEDHGASEKKNNVKVK